MFRRMVPLTTDWTRLQGSYQKSHQSGRKRSYKGSIIFPFYKGSWELGDSSSSLMKRGGWGKLKPNPLLFNGGCYVKCVRIPSLNGASSLTRCSLLPLSGLACNGALTTPIRPISGVHGHYIFTVRLSAGSTKDTCILPHG